MYHSWPKRQPYEGKHRGGYGDSPFCMFLSLTISIPLFRPSKIQKGISSARSDDTKSLKGMVLDWITLRDTVLVLPLSQNVKMNRGFYHPVTGGLLCSTGLDWNDAEQVPDIHTLLL